MHKKLLSSFLTVTASLFFANTQAQLTTISISSSPSDTICSGTSVTFTAAAVGGSHYQWLKNSVVVTGATNITYSSTTLANGDVVMCELLSAPAGTIIALSGPKVMTVDHIVVVAAISGADTVCRSGTTVLTDATAGGVWNTSNALIADVSPGGVVTGIAPGLDTITYSITNTCGTYSAALSMFVNTSPFLPPISGLNVICMGNSATYTDSIIGGTWNVSDAGVGSITPSGTVTAVSPGIDTVLYSLSNACGTTTRRRPIGIEAAPIVPPILGSNTVCQNDTIHLRDAPGGNWHSNNNLVAGVAGAGLGNNTGIVRGFLGGTATIVYVGANACGVDSATINITVNPQPIVYPIVGRDSVCPGDSVALLEVVTGGTWSTLNSSFATISATGNAVGIAAGIDTIYYSLSNSCGTTTQAFGLAVYCPSNVSVPVVPAQKEVSIYPNPTHEQFFVEGVDPALVQVVNMFGQIVSNVHNNATVSVSNLPEGVYFVTVFDEKGNVVVKQRLVKM